MGPEEILRLFPSRLQFPPPCAMLDPIIQFESRRNQIMAYETQLDLWLERAREAFLRSGFTNTEIGG